ncbi:MAG TPA: cytidine deaminase [Taishania sp.]|nr:cytidine deaminase [Taishania sp.]
MNELVIRFKKYNSWELLSQEDQLLVIRAQSAAQKAYAPYSKFQVGAAVLLEDGTIVLGSNQENIAFPSGLCAERVALFNAGANYPGKKIVKLVVTAFGDFVELETLLTPCGSCRQVMVESQQRQKDAIQVIMVSQNKQTIVVDNVLDLMPFAFNESF